MSGVSSPPMIRSFSSSLFFLLLLTCLRHSLADDIGSFVYAGCTSTKYLPGTPYQYNLNSLFSTLATPPASPPSPISPPHSPPPRGNLRQVWHPRLSSLCSAAYGGALQLQGCYLRYGNESFLGQSDKSIAYQKCGPGAGSGNYGDLIGMRDSVLAAINVGAGGPYRVARAGYVEGMAQCVGDLSAIQCGGCLADAINALRSACGLAVSGEVYLAKCYAKYWSKGGYGSPSSHGKQFSGDALWFHSLLFLSFRFSW
ncbi:unnamed protein product [Spirodela intermedia]|uniref:Gnk2-homologous domain-containing protein n=1 Tax=Spirodela intermedia TaxID=51605 RepID=A0A7I8J3H5_SPIIN|nr:unnamed protein product [Spirodela intermedia]CAA6664796.1 unnamed protein product [Spirodela intermedia]